MDPPIPARVETAECGEARGRTARSYLLCVLTLVLASQGVERVAFGLLLQDIKLDLGLSDTQLGLLTGIAFALFYSIMGIPIARWADRGNRVAIITLSTALWSAAVALCGTASSFLQLLAIRIGLGVGEAGCLPPAHSLIADRFTRAQRPRAAAIYMLGVPVGAAIGYLSSGWLNELYGWRTTFVILGVPGLALAILAGLTLREPRKHRWHNSAVASPRGGNEEIPAQPSLKEVLVTLWDNASFRHLLFCFAVASFFATGISKWQPAFFIRSYGLQTGELGTWLAVVYSLGGLLGTFIGGELASRFAANDERLQLRLVTIVFCGVSVVSAAAYLVPNLHLAFLCIGLATVGTGIANGPIFATVQTLVPHRMRAMSIAILFLFANLIGMGLGPLAAGVLSDAYRSWVGEESLRFALLTLCPGLLWCAWHVWRASGTAPHDIASTEAHHRQS